KGGGGGQRGQDRGAAAPGGRCGVPISHARQPARIRISPARGWPGTRQAGGLQSHAPAVWHKTLPAKGRPYFPAEPARDGKTYVPTKQTIRPGERGRAFSPA